MEMNFESAMCRFVLLGETLRSIRENDQLEGKKLELGMFSNTLTPEVVSLFKQWGLKIGDKAITTKIGNVPVEIKIIKRKYKFMEYLDFVWYKIGQFETPNPWRNAYKAKGLIK